MKTIRVVVSGSKGRMGQAVVRLVEQAEDLVLHAAYDVEGYALEAADGADVVVDFSSPAGAKAAALAAAERNVALVTGTTGLSAADRNEIARATTRIPIVLAPNMSVGANVLYRVAAVAARLLGEDYKPAVVEAHHRHKKDAPSGTALRLAEVLGVPREEVQAIRGGDVVGDHTVFLLGDGERVELTHRATTRDAFAHGALRAARWVAGRKPGLYDMAAVLGLGGP